MGSLASHLLTGGDGVGFTFHQSPGGLPALERVVLRRVEGPGDGNGDGDGDGELVALGVGEGEDGGDGDEGGIGGSVSEVNESGNSLTGVG